MQLLDSRSSRMSLSQALTTIHADNIGGPHANYRKWYFAAHLDMDDVVGQSNNPGLQRLKSVNHSKSNPTITNTNKNNSNQKNLNNTITQ